MAGGSGPDPGRVLCLAGLVELCERWTFAACFAAWGWGRPGHRPGRSGWRGYGSMLGEILRSVFQSVFGVFPLLGRDIGWETVPRGGWLPRALAVGRGLLLVLPLLLLFGALLTAADAVYQTLITQLFHFDPSVFVGHFFLTLLLAWLAAGFGRRLFLRAVPGCRPGAALEAADAGHGRDRDDFGPPQSAVSQLRAGSGPLLLRRRGDCRGDGRADLHAVRPLAASLSWSGSRHWSCHCCSACTGFRTRGIPVRCACSRRRRRCRSRCCLSFSPQRCSECASIKKPAA